MKFDIKKYVKNEDIAISNDDLDLEAIGKAFRKGYIKESEVAEPDYSNYVPKNDFTKLQNDYAELENNFNSQTKVLSDTNDKMARVTLESKMIRKGFDEKDFDEVVKLRNLQEEKDDDKALDYVKERYGATFFKQDKTNQFTNPPKEQGNMSGGTTNKQEENISISRKTKISDLFIK